MDGTSSLAATCPRDGPAGRRRAARRGVDDSLASASTAGDGDDGGATADFDLRDLFSLLGIGGGNDVTASMAKSCADDGSASENPGDSVDSGGGSGKSGGTREADLSCAMFSNGPRAPARRIPFPQIAQIPVRPQIRIAATHR